MLRPNNRSPLMIAELNPLKSILILICAAWLVAFTTQDAVASDIDERLQSILDSFHERGGFPGATIGYVLPDGTNGSVSTGLAFKETEIPMTSSHRLMAGSTGKTYFVALALQLVDEGSLDLDAKISTWLGEEDWFARLPNAGDITFRMLLNHTSGIPRYVMDPDFVQAMMDDPDRRMTPVQTLEFVFNAEPLFPAGKGWSYADTNFVVAAYIIEKVTGASCYSQIYDRILHPLEMWDIVPTTSRDLLGMAGGYVNLQNNLLQLTKENVIQHGRFAFNPQFEWAGGGFASTPLALAQWADLLYSSEVVLSEAMQKEMRTTVEAQLGPGSRYGLGLMQRPTDLGDVIGHSGYFPGYLTDMYYYVEHDIALAIQVNTTVMSREMNPNTMKRVLDECAKAILEGE